MLLSKKKVNCSLNVYGMNYFIEYKKYMCLCIKFNNDYFWEGEIVIF